jgi:drug/metabolite transporter (DMT)-like permease
MRSKDQTGPRHRYIVALVAGSVAYLLILYRFLSYSQRNHLPGDVYLTFAGAALAIGFVVTLGATKGRYRTVGFVLLGICIAHLLVMIADYQQDPTSHNLGPIELVILCIYGAPAYAGAGIAHIVDYVRTRSA